MSLGARGIFGFSGGAIGSPILFPDGSATAPSMAFSSDTQHGWYRSASGVMGYSVGGTQRIQFTAFGLNGIQNTSSFALFSDRAATAIVPTLCPNRLDSDSGVGWNAADNPCMVSGGAESARFEDPADLAATETSLWLYDLDNAAMSQVSVGADDSGGAGFKLLRVAN